MTVHEIRIDQSKTLLEEPATGHNRWHPDIPPVVRCQPGDEVVMETRAEQLAQYKERGAFISARMFRAAFGTDRRDDIAKYVIAVEVPGHAEHSQHDADPGFQQFNRLADAFQPEDPLVYGGQVLHAV